ncbi:MAG: CesT family type III secretion system chaperone [Haliea sp.]|nr:MAG: CesT family type III secretion system chaperone [Haliea sp.]
MPRYLDNSLAQLLQDLAARMGLASVQPDDNGAAAFCFDGQVTVNLLPAQDAAGQLWLVADLGPPAAGPAGYERLLQLNFLWRRTRGATVSLSFDTPARIVLAKALLWRHLDAADLAAELEQFLDVAADCSADLPRTRDDPPGHPSCFPMNSLA